MNDNQPPGAKSIKDIILEKISKEEVVMRSKKYFILKALALAAVALAVLLLSLVICNFILFSIRLNSHDALLGFGPRGFLVFLQLFPWSYFALDILLILILEWLLRRFRFGYRRPVLYLLFGILVLTTSVGFFIARGTDIDDRLLDRADQHSLPPPFDDLLENARRAPSPESGLCHCVITAIQGDTLTVYD